MKFDEAVKLIETECDLDAVGRMLEEDLGEAFGEFKEWFKKKQKSFTRWAKRWGTRIWDGIKNNADLIMLALVLWLIWANQAATARTRDYSSAGGTADWNRAQTAATDVYSALGLTPGKYSQAELKRARREVVKKHHLAGQRGDKTAEDNVAKANAAYDMLIQYAAA